MRTLVEITHAGRYATVSREPVYQLLLLLPLLVLYEVAAVLINFDTPFQVRNGADILLKVALRAVGVQSVVGFVLGAVLFVSLMIVAAMRRHHSPLKGYYFPVMLVESVGWGLVIGVASARLTGIVLASNPFLASGPGGGMAERLMIGIGAGVYEEIVFRALLITLLLGLLKRLGVGEAHRGPVGVVVSALLFSGFHYVGPFGEPFLASTFIFRVVAGLILSAIFVLRGLGISAWAHASYDVMLAVGVL